MRSLREALAGAPTAILAATLAVLVVGAGLFGFAIAELTSDEGGGGAATAPAAPSVTGGSSQGESDTSGASPAPVALNSASSRADAVALARKARAGGAKAEIIRFGGRWLVLVQSSQ